MPKVNDVMDRAATDPFKANRGPYSMFCNVSKILNRKNRAISQMRQGFSEGVGSAIEVRMKKRGTVKVIRMHGSTVILANSIILSSMTLSI